MANPGYFMLTLFTVAAGSNCVVEQMEDIEIGSSFQLACEHDGDNVTIFRGPDGNDFLSITGNSTNIVDQGNNTILTIKLDDFSDAGTYQCISGKNCKNTSIDLFGVKFPHKTSEKNQAIHVNREGVIQCTIMSNPSAIIEWYYNDTLITNLHEVRYVNGTNLVIKKASFVDVGNYTCRASLSSHNISRTLDIQVNVNGVTHKMKGTVNDSAGLAKGEIFAILGFVIFVIVIIAICIVVGLKSDKYK